MKRVVLLSTVLLVAFFAALPGGVWAAHGEQRVALVIEEGMVDINGFQDDLSDYAPADAEGCMVEPTYHQDSRAYWFRSGQVKQRGQQGVKIDGCVWAVRDPD